MILLVLMGWEDEEGDLIQESEVFAGEGSSKGVLEEKPGVVCEGCVCRCASGMRMRAGGRALGDWGKYLPGLFKALQLVCGERTL